MSDSERRSVVPFYWLAILVLAGLLAGAIFLLVRPNPPASEQSDGQEQQGEQEPDGEGTESQEPEASDEPEPEPSETGPLRAKLSNAVEGFEVESWAESAGLIKYGAVEAYEGFYVRLSADPAQDPEDVSEPTLIAAGRWESVEEAQEWLEDWVEEQPILPADFKAEGKVPGVGETDVGTYRYYESPDETEAGVVWTNNDLGLLLVGESDVVELLFTQLPL